MTLRDGMRTVPRRKTQTGPDECGIALVMVILTLFVLTTLAAAVVFVTQSEILTSANYKLATQARYAAEAGSQRAAHWLAHDYTPPANLDSFDITKYPVQYDGMPVVLSANASVPSNYPDEGVEDAFQTVLMNQPLPGLGTSARTKVTATLLSMQPASVFLSSNSAFVQTWQIASQGSIAGIRNAEVEVVTQIQNAGGQLVFPYAGFSTGDACDSFVVSGAAKVDSFDSQLGGYSSTALNTQGDMASNGTVVLTSANTSVYGTVTASALTGDICPAGTPSDAPAYVSGGFIHLSQAIAVTTPPEPSPAPPTSAVDIVNDCPAISGCSSAGGSEGPFTLTPGAYGNVLLSSGKVLHLSTGTYTVNSVELSGGANLIVDSGPIVIHVAGNSLGAGVPAVSFSDGSVSNTTGAPVNLQIVYAGSHAVNLSAALGASLVVYAPNAPLTLSGGGDLYGAIIASRIDNSGETSLHYDRSLANFVHSLGGHRTISFSWSKF